MILPSLKLFTLLCTLICLSVLADSNTTLVIGYGDHNAPPYAMEKGEILHDGIIKDIAMEISHELDINISFAKTSRKRTERHLENDTIHLILISNPAWLSNSKKLQWSEPIFIEKDIIVIKSDNPTNYQRLTDLKGMIIGTIRGYKYPILQDYFAREYFVRYDVSSLEVNFIRLTLGRIDAFIGASIAINHQFKKNKNAKEYKMLPISISNHNVHAALSPNAPITLEQFNKALKKLKDQGVIAAILQKYQM